MDYRVKMKGSEKISKHLNLAWQIKKKLLNMRMMVIPILVGTLGTVPKWFRNTTGGTGDQRENRDHTDHSIVKIDENTEKSPGDLRRLAVTHTSVKDHQLTLVWKFHLEWKHTCYDKKASKHQDLCECSEIDFCCHPTVNTLGKGMNCKKPKQSFHKLFWTLLDIAGEVGVNS